MTGNKSLLGGSGYLPLNPVNYEYSAGNYSAGADAGQVAGVGYKGVSSGIEATSGHATATTMNGGGGGGGAYGLNGAGVSPFGGPYQGYGGIDRNVTGPEISSLNTFQKPFSNTTHMTGGKRSSRGRRSSRGKRSSRRSSRRSSSKNKRSKSRRYQQKGCRGRKGKRRSSTRRRRSTMQGGSNPLGFSNINGNDYAQAAGTKYTFAPDQVSVSGGTIGMANPTPIQGYQGCGAKGL
jgi:hypothetical protein